LLEVINLTKVYGNKKVLDNLNFEIKENSVVGFLGANGAGKTSTLNIISGYSPASNGNVIINGIEIIENNARKNIGYLPDSPPLYPDMTVLEYLKFVCELKQIIKNESVLNDLMSDLDILEVKNKVIKSLSKGFKQRVGFAQALIGEPDLIILDEPMVALDPAQILKIKEFIKKLKKDKIVLISSHNLNEISEIIDRVIIIDSGKIIADDKPENLADKLINNKRIYVRVKCQIEDLRKITEKFNCLEYKLDIEPGSIDLTLEDILVSESSKDENNNDNEEQDKDYFENIIDLREKFFKFAKDNNILILIMRPYDMTLEEIFIKVIKNS
jgi:ABC-2 type transport system ATP-binding protein